MIGPSGAADRSRQPRFAAGPSRWPALATLACAASLYRDIDQLTFRRKRYRVPADGKTRKTITLLAPIEKCPLKAPVDVTCSDSNVSIGGNPTMRPHPKQGIAKATFTVRCSSAEAAGTLKARIFDMEAQASIQGVAPRGSTISVKLEDIDLGSQRYRWRGNVLEIAVRHPAVKRYLGPPPDFSGQDQKHFRVLVAEIVSDAVCSKIIERREMSGVYEDEEADFQFFSAELYSLSSEFAPLAHSLVLSDTEAR